MNDLADYAAGLMGALSSWWSSGSAAKRLFGDEHLHFEGLQEEERSMSATDKIDMHDEFVDISAQTMQVKDMASAIEPTRREPVRDFCEFGQAEYLLKLGRQSKLRSTRRSESRTI